MSFIQGLGDPVQAVSAMYDLGSKMAYTPEREAVKMATERQQLQNLETLGKTAEFNLQTSQEDRGNEVNMRKMAGAAAYMQRIADPKYTPTKDDIDGLAGIVGTVPSLTKYIASGDFDGLRNFSKLTDESTGLMKQWMDASKQPPGSVDPKMVQGLETQLLDKYKALTGNKQVVDMEVKGDKVVMIGANGQPIEELNPMQLIGQMHQVKGQVTKLSRAFEAYAAEMGDKEARNRIMAVGKSQEALGELAKHATTQEQLQAIQMARELIPTLGADKQTELLFSLKDKIQGDLKAKLNTEGSAFVMSEAARLSSILQPSTGKGKPASLAELDKTLRLKALSEYDKLTPAQKEFAGSPTAYGEMLVQANHNRLKERAGTEEAALKPANMAADIEQKLAHAAAYRAQAAKARFDLTQDKAGITAAKGMIAALSAQIQSLEKVKAANMLVTEEEKSSYNTELAALRKEFALYNEWIKKQEGITGVVKPIVPKVNQEVDLNAFFAQFPSGSVSASSSSRQPTGAVKTFQDVQRESMFNPNLQ